MAEIAQKREMNVEKKSGLQVTDLVLAAVLIAAGAVLKLFVGVLFQGGVKPNFIIAAYCLALLLIKPKSYAQGAAFGAIIGLITGAVCQIPLLCGTPFVNFASELAGGIVIGLIAAIPAQGKGGMAAASIGTFVATFISGGLFSAIVVVIKSMNVYAGLVQYAPIVVITALLNAIIVAILLVPLKKALHKD
ncbi:MAG: hypothetical protein ACOX69_00915 [Coriobacteriales bacterium]|jgi:hypothetical protein